MSSENEDKRLADVEEAVVLLTELAKPRSKGLWERLHIPKIRDLVYLVGVPALLITAYDKVDQYYLSSEEIRLEEQRNVAISRLDQLQEINSEIYQLQTRGDGNIAFALIEAKKGQIARLTDTVYLTWSEQPEMLKRHDLNALAEALLIQERTDDALKVAQTVNTDELRAIDAIDQQILKARIQFALGPAHDAEAARDHLRLAGTMVERIPRKGNQSLMLEKMLQIRLLNEGWLGQPCEKLLPMAEGLAELRDLNGGEDAYQSEITVQTILNMCRQDLDP